jgi:hypothetical protein
MVPLTNATVNIAGSASQQVLTGADGSFFETEKKIILGSGSPVGRGPVLDSIYVIIALDPKKHYVKYYDYKCVRAFPPEHPGNHGHWEFKKA